ncbi:heavy-metal-associated domain-containing protein [Streptomyces sp. FIT100]|uniref:heavy-metal-associated domain-containing protein n=1 Tax=Streptomyces sp. FIT100 TaxID=2837956 RepID=UPI0021C89808|nr:heavy-metal-associated domain-containing protein [Streptomyces sp. FIT100]
MKLFNRKNKTAEAETGPAVTLLVEGMHCTSCGLLIDDELEEGDGVRSSTTDVRTRRTVVRLDGGRRSRQPHSWPQSRLRGSTRHASRNDGVRC